MAAPMDEGEAVLEANQAARYVAACIERGWITAAGLDKLRQAMDQHRQQQSDPPAPTLSPDEEHHEAIIRAVPV